MPAGKMYRYKKKRTMIKPMTKSKFNSVTAYKATKALSIIRAIKRSQEKKHHDTPLAGVTLSNDGIVAMPSVILNNMSPGTTDTTRIGDSVFCTSLLMKYTIQLINNTTTSTRLIIFIDKYSNGLVAADILALVAVANVINSPRNYDKRLQSKIIYDRTHNLSNGGANEIIHVKKYIKLNAKTQFINGSLSFTRNVIHLLAFSDLPFASPDLPVLNFYSRLLYTDN